VDDVHGAGLDEPRRPRSPGFTNRDIGEQEDPHLFAVPFGE